MPDIFVSSKKRIYPQKESRVDSAPLIGNEVETLKRENRGNFFSAFVPSPKDWNFETQEQEEEIVLILRRHWLTNVGWVLLSFLLSLVPPILLFISQINLFPIRFRIVGFLIWYLLLVGFIFERFLDWFFNVFIITDERIIDFDFYGLIYKEISDAKIEDIQDVTYRMGGFLKNLFNFGDVFVQTAAQVSQFEFFNVPQPARVAKVLRELITEEEIEKIEGRVR